MPKCKPLSSVCNSVLYTQVMKACKLALKELQQDYLDLVRCSLCLWKLTCTLRTDMLPCCAVPGTPCYWRHCVKLNVFLTLTSCHARQMHWPCVKGASGDELSPSILVSVALVATLAEASGSTG